MKKWKTLSTKVVKKNPWWEYRLDQFEMPNGTRGEYNYIHTPGAVMIVAVDTKGRVAWSRAYRYILGRRVLQLPGGGRSASFTSRHSAELELKEETGLSARRWKKVGMMQTDHSISTEGTTVFLASSLEHGAAMPEATEDISLVWLTVKEADKAITSGKVKDSQSIAAWTLARPHVLALIDRQHRKR